MILVAFHCCCTFEEPVIFFQFPDLLGRAYQVSWQGGGKDQLAQPEILHGLAGGSTGRWTWSQGSRAVCLLLGVARQQLRSVHPFSLFLASLPRDLALSILSGFWVKRTEKGLPNCSLKGRVVRLSLCPPSPWWTINSKDLFQYCALCQPREGWHVQNESVLLTLSLYLFHCLWIEKIEMGCSHLTSHLIQSSNEGIHGWLLNCRFHVEGQVTRASCLLSWWCHSSDLSYQLTFWL